MKGHQSVARYFLTLMAVFLLFLQGCTTEPSSPPPPAGQEPKTGGSSLSDTASQAPKPAPPVKNLYDEKADASRQVADALHEARQDHKHVLIQWGGNWCPWCFKLHAVLESDRSLRGLLRAEYVYVPIESKNVDLAASYKAPVNSVPFLTVLDADNKVLANQPTDPLEDGDHYDAAKVKAFLEQWKPAPLDAEQLLAAALGQARKDQRSILIHFGAPWCIWCKRFDRFLSREDIQPLISPDFINLKIDIERMAGGEKVYRQVRKQGQGIPWFAILDANGEAVSTSDAPAGNIGFPISPGGIDHFLGMLGSSAHHLSNEGKGKIQAALQAEADQVLTSMRTSGRPN
ncbi:MAG: thioredoxin family protein [Candidatus Omnitrophica bacterium]|nr:thioredoxin family protein [bacterium]MCL4736020.1 thioredoxin family protein [Candidatus Omnitrophota bacterium]NUP92125.1 thioredoxin family protein [Candidatus Omnitrophota bacterium]